METFEITADHIKLLQRFNVAWWKHERGAPFIDPKRPYGNSDVEGDICEILGWPDEGDPDEGTYSDAQRERAVAIHRQMDTVLAIVLERQTFRPGRFQRAEIWHEWSAIPDPA